MATTYFGVALGGDKTDVTKSTSTTSSTVEGAVVTDATGASKTAVLMALQAIKARIIEDTWPPA